MVKGGKVPKGAKAAVAAVPADPNAFPLPIELPAAMFSGPGLLTLADLLPVMTAYLDRDLVYRFTLHPGATLAPGSYTFAAQYNHAAGTRSMAGDSYDATATAGATAHLEGTYLN